VPACHPGSDYHQGVRTRQLGPLTVTAVGGGDVNLAISAARGVSGREVERALHEAIDLGITLFDVAADPDGEKLVGDAVRKLRERDRIVVATRVPILAERAGAPTRDALRERLPAGYVQQRIEAALRASRLDVLPLGQLPLRPAWVASPSWAELVATCARLVQEGKVLTWGAIVDEPADDAAPALVAEPWLSAVSIVYHVCDRRAEPLLEAARQRKLATLARQPLAGGALAGTLAPAAVLPRDDRQGLDDAVFERIVAELARLAPLVKREPPALRSTAAGRQVAERLATAPRLDVECYDVAELALRFAIDRAGIALPRLHRREHVPAAVAAAAAPPLSAALVAQLVDDAG
jgi:aryl-alcohol dehydrogenase-like predicted oxidoreductase